MSNFDVPKCKKQYSSTYVPKEKEIINICMLAALDRPMLPNIQFYRYTYINVHSH
jgi:hypothetical protein